MKDLWPLADYITVHVPYMLETQRKNIHPFIRKIRKIRVVHGEGISNIQRSIYNNFIDKIKSDNFEQLLTVREKSERVNIFSREKNGYIRDILIIVAEKDEFSLVNLKGKFSQEIINGLVKSAINDEFAKR